MSSIALPSVQSLLLEFRFQGQSLASGTGFIVNSTSGPHLVTARHNVTGRHHETGSLLSKTGGVPDEVLVQHNSKARIGFWTPVSEPLLQNGLPRWKEHPSLQSRADFVALPLLHTTSVALHAVDPLNPGAPLLVGPADPVSVVGFPFGRSAGGFFAIWATGFLASEPDVDYNGLPLMLIDCRARPGQSGSPVLAYRNGGMLPTIGGGASAFTGPVWRFLGIYSGRISEQSDIGIVWKCSAIQQLVAAL